MSIQVDNLTKLYGTQKAVDGISFKVGKGEIVGFLGPNGAGKSTTMKIITGYLQADGGKAEVCGQQVMDNSNETKKKVGYLPEANPLYYDMYVREYLDFITNVHTVSNKKQKIEEVIGQVGLTIEANKKIGQLSKGYKQRVGLAAALIHDPEVLILDEPTSGLDPNQIVEIREVIKKLGKEKTVLFSSHILQEVQAICDRVIIINRGKIVADDLLQNLLGKQHFNELRLEIKEEVNKEIFEGIENIKQLNANTWLFKTEDADALKRKLIEITLKENLNIVSLQSETVGSLEDIFRTLTTETDLDSYSEKKKFTTIDDLIKKRNKILQISSLTSICLFIVFLYFAISSKSPFLFSLVFLCFFVIIYFIRELIFFNDNFENPSRHLVSWEYPNGDKLIVTCWGLMKHNTVIPKLSIESKFEGVKWNFDNVKDLAESLIKNEGNPLMALLPSIEFSTTSNKVDDYIPFSFVDTINLTFIDIDRGFLMINIRKKYGIEYSLTYPLPPLNQSIEKESDIFEKRIANRNTPVRGFYIDKSLIQEIQNEKNNDNK